MFSIYYFSYLFNKVVSNTNILYIFIEQFNRILFSYLNENFGKMLIIYLQVRQNIFTFSEVGRQSKMFGNHWSTIEKSLVKAILFLSAHSFLIKIIKSFLLVIIKSFGKASCLLVNVTRENIYEMILMYANKKNYVHQKSW